MTVQLGVANNYFFSRVECSFSTAHKQSPGSIL